MWTGTENTDMVLQGRKKKRTDSQNFINGNCCHPNKTGRNDWERSYVGKHTLVHYI